MKNKFFINGYEAKTDHDKLTGLGIKEEGRSVDPNLDLTHELLLEVTGGGADQLIGDDQVVDLRSGGDAGGHSHEHGHDDNHGHGDPHGHGHGHGHDHGHGDHDQGPKHFFTRPPTNFGSF